jgi:hypothetical protein
MALDGDVAKPDPEEIKTSARGVKAPVGVVVVIVVVVAVAVVVVDVVVIAEDMGEL